MKIVSRTKAMKLARIAQEKNPQKKLSTSKFCTGKYKFSGTITDWYEKEVQDVSRVLAVFPVRREDEFGPFVRLMAITLE